MKQKIMIVIIVSGLFELLLLSCCPDSELDFTKFTSIDIYNSTLIDESTNELSDSLSVKSEKFRIEISYQLEYIAQRNFKIYSNSLNATSCENKGGQGLRDKIKTITISCNKELFEFAPNQSLTNGDLIEIYRRNFTDDLKNERIPIVEWIEIFNNGNHQQSYSPWYFEFQEKIVSTEHLKFKMKIEFQSGETLERETNHIKIE